MKYRVVQKGISPVVVCYLVGSHMDQALRAACPERAIVATDQSGLAATRGDLVRARQLVGHHVAANVSLVGYSAGCQAVRKHLVEGELAEEIVVIDGTHASIPPAPWQLSVWRDAAEDARAGDITFVGTCTQMSYVERIPVGKPGRATSTRHVLEQACGVELPAGTEVHDGRLHLVSYPSKDVDHDAHVAQQRVVLPIMLADMVSRYVGEERDPAEAIRLAAAARTVGDRAVAPVVDAAKLVGGFFGFGPGARPHRERALEVLLQELGAGVVELPGKVHHHPRILAYHAVCVAHPIRGAKIANKPLGLRTDEDAWCCALQSWVDIRAALPGDAVLPPRGAVWERVADAMVVGRFRDRSTGYRPRAGDQLIFGRAGGDPRTPGQSGHITRAVIDFDERGDGRACGGNEGNTIKLGPRSTREADYVGAVVDAAA